MIICYHLKIVKPALDQMRQEGRYIVGWVKAPDATVNEDAHEFSDVEVDEIK